MSSCQQALINTGTVIPGFSKAESAEAICATSQYCKGFNPQHPLDLVPTITTSRLGKGTDGSTLSKSVIGGMQHVVSADNAAGYAELWYKGGSWYAVTDAALSKAFDPSTSKSAIWELPGITKGMSLAEATPRFLEAVFGPLRLAKSGDLSGGGGCGCGKK